MKTDVIQDYVRIDIAALHYGKSERTIWRRLSAHPEIRTVRRNGRTLVWMPALDREMRKPTSKGGRPVGTARPRLFRALHETR